MSEKEISVKFKTITPLWTGDAWMECKEIRPSSLMGSLRFWFEVYCHFAGNNVSYEKENLDYKWFEEELKRRVRKNSSADVERIALEIAREKFSLLSFIFGCTGWRSRVKIESIKFRKRTIKDSEFDYNYLHSQDNNTKWWTKKVLFNNKEQIDVFENITVKFKIDSNALSDVKKFFKFCEDKPILMGGKKAFGFGFVKLKSDLDLNNVEVKIKKEDIVVWDNIKIKKNNITGYNIKYFLRKKENKEFRAKNFGKMSRASNFYFSMPKDGEIYIIIFNNKNILDKYKKWIEESELKQSSNRDKASINDLKNKWGSR